MSKTILDKNQKHPSNTKNTFQQNTKLYYFTVVDNLLRQQT